MKPALPGGNQYQDWTLSHCGGTDYLVVGYGEGRIYHDPAEHLVVYVPVQMFHQLPVRESGVCLQDHEGDLCAGTEYVPAAQTLVRQAHSLCHTL